MGELETANTKTMRVLRELQVRESEFHEWLCSHGQSEEMTHALVRFREAVMWARKGLLRIEK